MLNARSLLTATIAGAGLCLAAAGQTQSFIEGFDTAQDNEGGWHFSGFDTWQSAGGNPGGYRRVDGLDTFAPLIRTQAGSDTIFHGNYIEQGVRSLGIDARTFNTPTTAGRPMTLMLVRDTTAAYFLGPNIPSQAQGWVSYNFTVPSGSPTLPTGWQLLNLNDIGSPPELSWSEILQDVQHVRFHYGDPTMFFIFQMWNLGMDNPRITWIPPDPDPDESEVIYETEDPFDGPFGLVGFDVFSHQSVATRFTPNGFFTLDRVMPWFMNNSDTDFPTVTLSLRTDLVTKEGSFPSDEVLESWTFDISTLGWNPVQEELESALNPLLEDGANYWLVAESDSGPFVNAVWTWAQPDSGYMSICNTHPDDPPGTCEWTAAATGAVVAVTVEGTPADPPPSIPGDLNNDGVVNVTDLLLLLGQWGDCASCTPGNCPADLNGDCTVNVTDLLLLLGNWG